MNLDQGIVLHQAWRRFNIHTSCFSHSAEGHMTGSGNGGEKSFINRGNSSTQPSVTEEDPQGRNV